MKIGKWTIVVPDKMIIKQYGDFATRGYIIDDNNFWKNNLNENIRAVQYTGNNLDKEQVEHNDGSSHTFFSGNIKIFADEWDKKHLIFLQDSWDSNNIEVQIENDSTRPETLDEKINRLGLRPTIYNSVDVF
jgi:hypothetical protein